MRHRYILLAVLSVAIIALAGCNGTEEEPPAETKLETGLELEEKTAGWSVTQALEKARDWRGNARLVYLEWRNCNPKGILEEGDSVDLYFSSEWSQKFYKVVVDHNGATDYSLGEVAKSVVFEENQDSFVFNWTQDSDVILDKAQKAFVHGDEELVRLMVVPARTTDLDMTGNLAVVRVYTTEQDMFYNGNSGKLIEQRVVKY